LGRDLRLKAGDLVFWRYSNQHAVLDVEADPEQLGFLRILFVPEILYAKEQVDKKLETK